MATATGVNLISLFSLLGVVLRDFSALEALAVGAAFTPTLPGGLTWPTFAPGTGETYELQISIKRTK